MTAFKPYRLVTDFFFVTMAVVALAVVLIGFATTFFIPVAEGRFHAAAVVYLHGLFALTWIGLFIAQPAMIRMDRFSVHVILGSLGLAIALGVAVTGIATGLYATNRDLAAGQGEIAISSLLGTCTSMLMFVALVAAGVLNRSNPEVHKRLMLLSTLVLIWPAWFRFRHYFPQVPRPDIVFGVVAADSMIVLAMLRDRLVTGRIHPVLLGVGLGIIAENTLEIAAFDTPVWRTFSHAVYDFLS
jgi:hypothetical protein